MVTFCNKFQVSISANFSLQKFLLTMYTRYKSLSWTQCCWSRSIHTKPFAFVQIFSFQEKFKGAFKLLHSTGQREKENELWVVAIGKVDSEIKHEKIIRKDLIFAIIELSYVGSVTLCSSFSLSDITRLLVSLLVSIVSIFPHKISYHFVRGKCMACNIIENEIEN